MLTLLGRFEKQPAEIKDYIFSAAAFLLAKADTLTSYELTAETGIVIVSHALENNSVIRLFVSGGVDGMTYKITCTFTTLGGRREQGEIEITVTEV